MADSEISFNKLVSEIKQIVDLTLFNPKEFDKWQMSHVIHRTITNTTIAIPFTTDYYWLHVIQYVRTKSKKWDSKLSDEYIANELTELIIDIKTDETKYSEFGKSIKTWLEYLKKLPRINFRFVLPVNNVDYRKDIEFDKIKLKKINLEVLRSFVPFREDEIRHFSAEEQLKDLTSLNGTEVFAFIDVQAKDEKQGREIAHYRPFDENGFIPNTAMAWGAQPYKGHVFFSDFNSGLWSVKVKPVKPDQTQLETR